MSDTAIGSNNRKKPLNLNAIIILVTGLTDFLRIILVSSIIRDYFHIKYLLNSRFGGNS